MNLVELSAANENRLKSIAADGMDIFLLGDGSYRGGMLHGTRLVNQMRANHGLGIMETLILGHAYLAAGLLTSLVKGNDRIRLDISCDGPIKGVSVDANARGEIRGYLKNSNLQITQAPDSFDTSPYIGGGTLTVTRTLEGSKEPVTGHVKIHHGAIASDLATYFVQSEQKPSAISVSIQFDHHGEVVGAGALFIQELPEHNHSQSADIDTVVTGLPSLGAAYADGETPAHLIATWLGLFEPEIIASKAIEMKCPCSRDRFARYMESLPRDEMEALLREGPIPAKVTCHYCSSAYMYEREELEKLLKDN